MAQPRNIEFFNQVVAVTLVKLYQRFPTPLDLCGNDIGAEACSGFTTDQDDAFVLMATAADSIGFLVHEGFVRYEPSYRALDSAEFPQAVLTLKGFTLLGCVPEGVDTPSKHEPFIEQLSEAAREGAKASVSAIVGSLFTTALQLGVSAVLR